MLSCSALHEATGMQCFLYQIISTVLLLANEAYTNLFQSLKTYVWDYLKFIFISMS